jgi:phosphoglycolate phosphatase
MKRLVIFDLDGTILDTLADLTGSVNFAMGRFGFAPRSIDEVCAFVGNGIGKLIERAVPAGTDEAVVAQALSVFKEHYGEHCADLTKPYDGVPDMLRRLRASGVKVAVLSNKADYAVVKLCAKYFDGLTDLCAGEIEGVPRKPSPEGVNRILDKLGIDSCDAVYVGDSDVDIATARNANMDEILVSWGFRGREFLAEHGAKIVVDTPEEILSYVGL